MKKKIIFGILLLLNIGLVLANGGHEDGIEEGKRLIESDISCDELSDEQLEAIGEYYMEQMHPGEAHEAMHEMMGIEEGTEYHKDFHINMAEMMHCDADYTAYSGMMGSRTMMGGGMMMPMMRMMMGGNMMNSGMMGNNPIGFGYSYYSIWNIVWYLFWIGIIALVIWLIYKFVIQKERGNGSPMDIVKKRYAKGEITKKQFEEIKRGIVR